MSPESQVVDPASLLSVHDYFDVVATRHEGRVALVFKDQELTYGELNKRSNHLAMYLQSIGVKAADVVAIRSPRSFDFLVSVLAILKCGAAYLPVDESNPEARNRLCLDIANVKIVISSHEENEAYAQGWKIVSTNNREHFETLASEFHSEAVDRDACAYVMFTSGSTGDPKGVRVPHRAILRLVINTNYVDISQEDSILQFAPLSFDASTFELWGALLNGAKLVLYSGGVLDPNLLKQEIGGNNVSILWLTAALFHLITENFIESLRPLRILLAGGDVLNAKSINKVLDYIPGVKVINGYGPTENTTFTCCHVMTAENRPTGSVPIGKAITGTEIYVLDDHMEAVSTGQEGELFASGDGVALGYLNSQENDNAFIHDDRIAPTLIYRTGDLVRENSRGEIEFIGRKDNQIKLRGYRVSLEEIKSNIVKMNEISDAIVLRRSFPSGDQLLVAYIQIKDGYELESRAVRGYLTSNVPGYMVPDQFVFDSNLPITANGKLDRKSIERLISERREVKENEE